MGHPRRDEERCADPRDEQNSHAHGNVGFVVPVAESRRELCHADGDDTGDGRRYHCEEHEKPAGSAGKPALTVLKRRDLENAVVVTRYYGGTDLGVGGLARAYGRAVKAAVDDAGVIEERPHERSGCGDDSMTRFLGRAD